MPVLLGFVLAQPAAAKVMVRVVSPTQNAMIVGRSVKVRVRVNGRVAHFRAANSVRWVRGSSAVASGAALAG
ncbi:MAG: hypothetical protein WBP81_38930 [Solirubrobacteraceae bacterium]